MGIIFKMLPFLGYLLVLNAIVKTQVKPENGTERIALNQVGYYPNGPKIAVIKSTDFQDYRILTADNRQAVYSGTLKPAALAALNGKSTAIADFSDFKKEGTYILYIAGLGFSAKFSIKDKVFDPLAQSSIKAFYYQRASTSLRSKHAGKWNRNQGHPDDKVVIHSSAATKERPTGTLISAPKGWYDAGDYNKYIVNSGITMGTLLSLYEDFPAYSKKLNLNIPESGNGVPDLLNEVIWNLRWMLAMQDPNDGGVYHKLTTADFDKFEMPEWDKQVRYVVQKGTAATLDFAAVTAQAARIFKSYPHELPGLADSCLQASLKAWQWANKNPNVVFNQVKMNSRFKPEISTGAYGDRDFSDEFIWAASELYVTTGNEEYYPANQIFAGEDMPIPTWSNVKLLGYYTLVRRQSQLKGAALQDLPKLKKKLIDLAESLITNIDKQAYQTVMEKKEKNFGWGSNSLAANQGIALIQAYQLTSDQKYLKAALSNLDYLLGRNATGYCYVTGFGHKSPQFPHHRPSATDEIAEPIPGLLVGGPNPAMQDKVALESTVPDEAYIDDQESYATNEVAINWNAPLAYLVNSIQALHLKAKD